MSLWNKKEGAGDGKEGKSKKKTKDLQNGGFISFSKDGQVAFSLPLSFSVFSFILHFV